MGGYPPGWCVCGRGVLIVSVGKKQECVPACCIVLRYKYINLLVVLGDDGTYMYGIIPLWPIQGVWVLSVV